MTAALDRPDRPVSVVAPDPAVRWLAVLALALGGFAIGTTEFVAMGLLPDIASSLNVTEPTAGHVISAYAMGVVIGAPIIAALAARVPRKILLLTLMGVFTLGNLASVLAPSYETLMIARFVAGVPHGAYFGHKQNGFCYLSQRAASFAWYVKMISAPARCMPVRISSTTRFSSSQPFCAAALTIAYSPLTL